MQSGIIQHQPTRVTAAPLKGAEHSRTSDNVPLSRLYGVDEAILSAQAAEFSEVFYEALQELDSTLKKRKGKAHITSDAPLSQTRVEYSIPRISTII